MRDKVRRAGWLFLTILFLGTGVGIGVYAFWQGTHQSKDQTQTQAAKAASCTFSGAIPAEVLPVPDAYKPGAKTQQLIISDLTSGNGKRAQAGDCIIAKYYGSLAANGILFDEDFTKPLALKFPLGQGQVIPGWDQGLVGLREGGTRRLVIPSNLAYGSQGQGPIPANSDLVFVVKLISISSAK